MSDNKTDVSKTSGSKLATVTRRTFLASAGVIGGGLALGLTLSPNRLAMNSPGFLQAGELVLNTWVKLTPDNRLTVIIPHSEMGQGAGTGLAQMLAEEMDAAWETVSIEQAPADDNYINSDLTRGYLLGDNAQIPAFAYRMLDFTFYQLAKGLIGQLTGGSTAISLTGQHGMRRAGAAAREMLLKAAATTWEVPVDSLRAENSTIVHAASGRSASFGEFASLAATYTPNLKPALKDPAEYKIIGVAKPRLDVPAKVDGRAQFGIDVNVPGMKYAAIEQAPVFGSQVKSLNDAAVVELPWVHKVVNLSDAVAVVADSYWEASRALKSIEIEWQGGITGLDSDGLRQTHNRHLDGDADEVRQETMEALGDAPAMLDSPDTVSVEYATPYLAHATMEPMNCTAWVRDGQCDVWVGHQNPVFARNAIAETLGMEREQVVVHNMLLGGGFGRRSEMDNLVQAVKVAEQLDVPVKLIWSREQDMANDFYRPAVVSRMRGRVKSGRIQAMSNSYIYIRTRMPDSERPFDFRYDVPNKLIGRCVIPSPIPTGSWRSVDFSQMAFFNESFIDELAHAAGQDPLLFRLAHKADERERAVLERLVDESNWGRPSVAGAHQGVAIIKSFGSIVGQVVEVSVAQESRLRVNRVTSVVDCGQVVNPNAAEAQIHSGVIYGLTAALFSEITLDKGEVVQQNFPNYDMIRLKNSPQQVVRFMDNGHPPGGLGEPGTPPAAPALTNAIFAATGTRIRELPITRSGFSVV